MRSWRELAPKGLWICISAALTGIVPAGCEQETLNPIVSPPLGWCQSQSPAPTVCQDFDAPDAAAGGLGVTSSGGTIQLDTRTSTSPPASLVLSVDGQEATPLAFFGASNFFNGAPSSIRLQYDLLLDEVPDQVITHQIRFSTPGDADYQVQLFLKAGEGYALDNKYGLAGSFIKLTASPKVGVWSHIDQRITLHDPPTMQLLIDSVIVLPPTPLQPQWKTGSVVAQIGISSTTAGYLTKVNIDNVSIDAR